MRRTAWSALAGVCAGVAVMAGAGVAGASSGIDSPESGVEQAGRGSAWVARADSPMAAFYNPAAMAFQANGVHVGAQGLFGTKCYARLGPDGKPVSPDVTHPTIPSPEGKADPNILLPAGPAKNEVCAKNKFIPVPTIGATFRLADRFALGFALVAPHAVGASTWPESLPYKGTFADLTEPAPNRYMLINADSLIIFPTVSFAWAPTDYLAFGAGFVWGIATVEFSNFTEATSSPFGKGDLVGDRGVRNGGDSDIKATLKAKDLFIPGVILSALWMPTSNLDVAAWYKYSDAVRGTTSIDLESKYWKTSGARNDAPCDAAAGEKKGCNITNKEGAGTIKFSLPMEAKIGLRYHHPRQNVEKPSWATKHPDRKVRDPMSEDLFDVELDFTWANNSAVDNIELRFKKGILVKGAGGGTVPANGDIPHMWKDVVGVRLGADVVVLPSRLSLRAGGFFETKGQDDSYLNLDFDVAQKGGVSGGATVRVGPVDISAMYGHTFYGTLDNGGKGNVHALSGDGSTTGCPVIAGTKTCQRSQQAVNGGILKASLNEGGLAATVRW